MIDQLLIKEWFEEYLDNLQQQVIFQYSKIKVKESDLNLFLFVEDLLIPNITENNKVMNKTYIGFIQEINVFYKHESKEKFINYLDNLLSESKEYQQFLNRLNHEFISAN